MPVLERLLTGDRPPGVYQWTAAPPVEKVRFVVENAGWRFVEFDTTMVVDKAGLLDTIATTFGFPSFAGRNFDAMACLREVRDEVGVVVFWDGWAGLADLNPPAAVLALEMFTDRTADTEGGPFVVLLAGMGPDLGVETLD